MGVRIPRDVIPESVLVPTNMYLASVETMERSETKGPTANNPNAKLPAGCLMYTATFRIAEPTAHAGLPLFDNYTIGTNDDLEANDPETWKASVGARRWEAVLKAAGVQSDDEDDILAEVVSQQVLLDVTEETDDGSNNAQFKGRKRNRINRVYKPGEREVGKATTALPAPTRPTAPRTAAAPVAARPATPSRRPTAAPSASRTAPVRRAAKAATVTCKQCDPEAEVPRDEFAAHYAEHNDAEQE
ncbi:hypothetical protein CMI37_00535 [Candidatus Pacearchaeota archaeon]|nr:hypothetical protein [Candidatus Pacearchaeota archaeon]